MATRRISMILYSGLIPYFRQLEYYKGRRIGRYLTDAVARKPEFIRPHTEPLFYFIIADLLP